MCICIKCLYICPGIKSRREKRGRERERERERDRERVTREKEREKKNNQQQKSQKNNKFLFSVWGKSSRLNLLTAFSGALSMGPESKIVEQSQV